jgi:hypothetical protein
MEQVELKFLLDNMLGKLAKWLRILGYDAVFLETNYDDELIELAMEEKRILLTRDQKLAKNFMVPTLLIKSEKVDEQLLQVVKRYGLEMEEHLLTRCPKCNLPLKQIDKEDAREFVPEMVYNSYEEFWMCSSCQRRYWSGTHWQNIKKKVSMIKERIDP